MIYFYLKYHGKEQIETQIHQRTSALKKQYLFSTKNPFKNLISSSSAIQESANLLFYGILCMEFLSKKQNQTFLMRVNTQSSPVLTTWKPCVVIAKVLQPPLEPPLTCSRLRHFTSVFTTMWPTINLVGGLTMISPTCRNTPPISLTPNCCTTLTPISPRHCHRACGVRPSTEFPA